jgi:hypothetical protein
MGFGKRLFGITSLDYENCGCMNLYSYDFTAIVAVV